MAALILVLGDQLTETLPAIANAVKSKDTILMAEVREEATRRIRTFDDPAVKECVCAAIKTKDGWILISVGGQPLFERWAKLMGEDLWLNDERFASDYSRCCPAVRARRSVSTFQGRGP